MESIFTTLAAAGVARNDLYLAWDFTVASARNIDRASALDPRRRLRPARLRRARIRRVERLRALVLDHGDRLESGRRLQRQCGLRTGGVCDLASTGVTSNIFRRVTGTYAVERYVDSPTPPARFVLDANGLPVHQATPQPASFICNIPRAALPTPARPAVPARASIYGHGLLGSNTEVSSGNVRDMANEHNFVFCATKWIGMADEDIGERDRHPAGLLATSRASPTACSSRW